MIESPLGFQGSDSKQQTSAFTSIDVAIRRPAERTLQESKDRPAAQHAHQVNDTEQERQGAADAPVEKLGGDTFLVLHGENNKRRDNDYQDQKTKDTHRCTIGEIGKDSSWFNHHS
jgi:hypothetical protein